MYQEAKNIYHLFQAVLANILYGFATRDMKIVGVTGTDGKTTTTSLIYHILKESNRKVALISTVGAFIDGNMYDTGFHVTTPSSFSLQKYIRKAKSLGASFVILEITSHALDQNRAFGISFEVGVITNVSHEHLDYHKSYDRYLKAKIKLLESSKKSVVNADDPSFFQIQKTIKGKIITYSLVKNEANFNPRSFKFDSKLIGKFNESNILAAAAAADALAVEREKIRKAISTFILPPGRQEVVFDKDFTVMIDFAHTPNAFAQILSEIAKVKKGKLIHVFGSAGERDATKRPFMGEESGKYADIIVLTAEDPRNESIDEINRDIQAGIGKEFKELSTSQFANSDVKKRIVKINDRRNAIRFAINAARKGDFVLLTGKSHEKSINYGNGEKPWDEFEEVKQALKTRGF